MCVQYLMTPMDLLDGTEKIMLAIECLSDILSSELLRDAITRLDFGGVRRVEVSISIRDMRVGESISIRDMRVGESISTGEVRAHEKMDIRDSLTSSKAVRTRGIGKKN